MSSYLQERKATVTQMPVLCKCFINKEGIDFEKHFKVHALLRSTKLNRWYTSVTIGNICIQYTCLHVIIHLKKGAISKGNDLNKNSREENTT